MAKKMANHTSLRLIKEQFDDIRTRIRAEGVPMHMIRKLGDAMHEQYYKEVAAIPLEVGSKKERLPVPQAVLAAARKRIQDVTIDVFMHALTSMYDSDESDDSDDESIPSDEESYSDDESISSDSDDEPILSVEPGPSQ
jgi:hypothetical protein